MIGDIKQSLPLPKLIPLLFWRSNLKPFEMSQQHLFCEYIALPWDVLNGVIWLNSRRFIINGLEGARRFGLEVRRGPVGPWR